MAKIDKWKAKVVKTPKFLTGDVTAELPKNDKKSPDTIAAELVNQNLADLLVRPPEEIAITKIHFISEVATALANMYGRGYAVGRNYVKKQSTNKIETNPCAEIFSPLDEVKISTLKYKKVKTI